MTDTTALYYAFSTIAQVAAALAALIGFLGLWKLDQLRREREELERHLRGLLAGVRIGTGDALVVSVDRVIQLAKDLVANPPEDRKSLSQKIHGGLERWDALPHEEQSLMRPLLVFLPSTLIILVLAIIGILFVNDLAARVGTPWLIGVASLGLGVGPAYVLFRAGRYI